MSPASTIPNQEPSRRSSSALHGIGEPRTTNKEPSSTNQELTTTNEERFAPALNAAERESIDLMVNLAAAVGLPRSAAEIYGLLFVAPSPLCLDQMKVRLGISKGSASQGLRLLRNLGAILPVVHPGDRRTFYRAETRLKAIIPGFIREQIMPRLEGWPHRIEHLGESAVDCSPEQQRIIEDRVNQLDGWARKAKLAMPIIQKLIGG